MGCQHPKKLFGQVCLFQQCPYKFLRYLIEVHKLTSRKKVEGRPLCQTFNFTSESQIKTGLFHPSYCTTAIFFSCKEHLDSSEPLQTPTAMRWLLEHFFEISYFTNNQLCHLQMESHK